MKKLNKKFLIFHVIIIVRNHLFLILKLFWAIKGFILYQTKQTALKSGYDFKSYDKFTEPAVLKNCKAENPSLLFCPLAQYLGSDKQRVLSPCVTYVLYKYIFLKSFADIRQHGLEICGSFDQLVFFGVMKNYCKFIIKFT